MKSAPMLITARMSEPVIHSVDLIHIDGPLAWSMAMDHLDAGGELPDADSVAVPYEFDLPLDKWRVGDHWGWCASAELDPWERTGIVRFRKRPEPSMLARLTRDKKANLGTGAFKAYDIPFPTVHSTTVTWAARGYVSEVERLLRRVRSIGRKRSTGNGRVLEWTVEEVDVDWSTEIDGQATRSMPVESGLTGVSRRAALRPPYYHRYTLTDVVQPYRGS